MRPGAEPTRHPSTGYQCGAGIFGHTPYRLSALLSADSLMPQRDNLANNPKEVSQNRCFCGTVGIASESRVHALTRGRPLISASALHHTRTTTAMCGIPFQTLRFP